MTHPLSRRVWIEQLFGGIGIAGIAGLLPERARAAILGHYSGPRTPGKAKRVISLFMAGGPSQLDMFDPKPSLLKYQGQRPNSVDLRTERQTGGRLPSPFEFRKYGRNGVDVSSLLPQLAAEPRMVKESDLYEV
jgi:hypothetical protein